MAGSGNNAITACPHKSKRHYAKGMCGACYRKQRLVSVRSSDQWKPREKLQVTMCEHADAKHYARGLCATCYRLLRRDKMLTASTAKDTAEAEAGPPAESQPASSPSSGAERGRKGLKKRVRRDKQVADNTANENAEAGPPVEPQPASSSTTSVAERGRKGIKTRTKCPHKTAGHYAKGYCKQCYLIVHRNPNSLKAEDGASTSSAKRKSHETDTESDAAPDNKE